MKKTLMIGAIALFGAVSAQEYKPTAGDVTVDLGLSGGLGNTSVNLANQSFGIGPMFKARYFKTDNLAYRMTMIVGNNSDTDNPNDNTVVKNNDFGIGLGFGLEKHYTGTERLSPYIGGDVLVGYASENTKTTVTPPAGTTGTVVVTETTGPNAFRLGVRGVFGADYYFAKRVFLGVEAGLAVMYSSEGETTFSQTGSPDVTVKGSNNFRIEPAVVTGIRLGFAF